MRKVEIIKPKTDLLLNRTKVAAYCRVSVDAELSEHSFMAQVSYYSTLINKNPKWVNAGIFADYGLTGTKANRPGFQNLLSSCENGKVDYILVKSISRFCRNTVDLLETVRHLTELGINVHFEKENIDTISSEGELMLSIFASLAQEESRSISENVKWIIRKKFEKGIPNSYVIYGYKWDGTQFNIIPEQAEIVKEIYSRYLKGDSPDCIASDLQKRNIKSTFGSKFHYTQVCKILRLEKYTGNSMLQKTYRENHLTKRTLKNNGELPKFYAEETHPAIISQQMFDAVQMEIARRAELGFFANQSIPFSCFTQKLICSTCGHTFRRRNKGTDSHHKQYYYWKCGTKISDSAKHCNADNIPETVLYELTSDVLGISDFSKADFDRTINHITVQKHNTLTFHLNDGTTQTRQWKVKATNNGYREKEKWQNV